jgi:hypothetical protein
MGTDLQLEHIAVNVTPAGDHMAMLRDPWGLALQLCQRAESMVA